jgi:hypothetical protein
MRLASNARVTELLNAIGIIQKNGTLRKNLRYIRAPSTRENNTMMTISRSTSESQVATTQQRRNDG